MNVFELVGTIFGVVCVVLMIVENIWCWPASLANAFLYFVMFWKARLYADLLTYTMFIVLSIHGWIEWLHGGPQRSARKVTRSPRRELVIVLACVAAGAPLLGTAFARLTDASYPYADSTIAALSFGAQYLLNVKRVESWALWILVDVIAIAVYLGKQLYLATGLYAVYLVLAVIGLVKWKRQV
jgi:nicotinamide mononucleotide transporter